MEEDDLRAGSVTNPTDKQLRDMLISEYRADPRRFHTHFPEIAGLLEAMAPPRRVRRSPFGLTERQRGHHQAALSKVVGRLGEGSVSPQEAVRGLEHCATLIQDDSLPEDVVYDTLVTLLKAAIGKSPGTFKSVQTIPVSDRGGQESLYRVSLVKGVALDLDKHMRLSSITVTPSKVRKRRKSLDFVGIGRDTAPDVARRHDDYLADRVPHATA